MRLLDIGRNARAAASERFLTTSGKWLLSVLKIGLFGGDVLQRRISQPGSHKARAVEHGGSEVAPAEVRTIEVRSLQR